VPWGKTLLSQELLAKKDLEMTICHKMHYFKNACRIIQSKKAYLDKLVWFGNEIS
jgi:hypothetical protein